MKEDMVYIKAFLYLLEGCYPELGFLIFYAFDLFNQVFEDTVHLV